MKYKELEDLFNATNEIKFKLYSLEYIIKKQEDKVVVYSLLYSNRKSFYSSFKEAMNNFEVYREPLIENIDRINIIKDQ